MSDFENRLTELLSQRADTAPGADDLAAGARVRLRRRRTLRAGAVAAAVVVAAVGVPLGMGALDVDAKDPGVSAPGPQVSTVPAGWRFESYHDVEFAVPPTWSRGSLSDWCSSGGSLKDSTRVERPNTPVNDILCPSSGYGVRIGAAPENPPAGATVLDTKVGGITVSVVAADADVADQVIGSVHAIAAEDFNGCKPKVAPVPAIGQMTGGAVVKQEPVALCRYEFVSDGADLVDSETIDPADYESFWLGFDTAEAGTGPDARPDTCTEWPETQAVLVRSGGQDSAWVHYDGCGGHGVDVGGTTYELNAQVTYWTLPLGGFGVDGSVPLPKEMRH